MPSSPVIRPFPIAPVTGFLDTRSTPDEVPFNGYRWLANAQVTTKHRLCRLPGFEKLLSAADYNNSDLHDQLFSLPRQPINFLYQAESTSGFSKLFAGTKNRIYALNNSTGNWKIISDTYGGEGDATCQDQRWMAGIVNNTITFSNNRDEIVYHVVDQPVLGDNEQSVQPVPDLVTLTVKKAGVVIAWNNLVFLMNLEMDGARIQNRIIWSDYKRPLSYIPSSASLAGRFDLDSGEAIINAMPLGSSLLIYTNKGIWAADLAGGTQVVSFTRRYRAPKTGVRCLAFKHTLVATEEEHFFWGEDGIYRYDYYVVKPELTEWVHRASAYIFEDLDKAQCLAHHGSFIGAKNTVVWSWSKNGDSCPSMSFAINREFPFSSFWDHGFTAFATYEPDNPMTFRQFLMNQCICTATELVENGEGFVKEGGYCTPQVEAACSPVPANFYSANPLVDGALESEDYTQSTADLDSLYALLGSNTVQDLCEAEVLADECNAETLFIGASSEDNCVKQLTDVYYREICSNNDGCGTYVKNGYKTILRSGPLDLGIPNDGKLVTLFAIEAYPEDQAVPSQMVLKVGVSGQAHDPSTASGRRVIMFEEQDPKDLVPLSDVDAAQQAKEGTRPDTNYEWPLFKEGRYIYWELSIVNSKVNPTDTGGACCLSRFDFYSAPKPRSFPS